ncbi:hypothetical protein BOTBODRAFT_161059 [Botryobasidium botryosum FD-172 SS1]|uniref:Alpha/beta hydrolase fold-3 domain-containing protein n=1 Tax=Botryobasidium botryosum (strain FD-172 SS1) TaxID=930990 RepID=A0A067MAU9_BOTB1|nr:hypothetical protein BOTBODRAFT_161059 [Botryobasidium botryosum FD-172 SS1]
MISVEAPIVCVYKTVGEIVLRADVHLPAAADSRARPAIVYFHGGGLTCGDRGSWKPEWMIREANARSWIFISADYRLLLPCTSHDILEDVKDLFSWVSSLNPIPELADSTRNPLGLSVDASRLIAAGTSAGGYLAYLAALWAEPRPKAVVSMYGMGGDFMTSRYLTPKNGPFPSDRPFLDPDDPKFAPLLSESDPPAPLAGSTLQYDSDGVPADPRMIIHRLFSQQGTYLDYVVGEKGMSTALNAQIEIGASASAGVLWDLIPERARGLFPQFHITKAFPPTLFIHGTADTMVWAQESVSFGKRLDEVGVPNKVALVEGAGHSFDYHTEGVHEAMLRESIAFVAQYIN